MLVVMFLVDKQCICLSLDLHLLDFLFQAGGFLVAAQNHAVPAETELVESIYSKKDDESLFLLEQVFFFSLTNDG